ncbi:DUF1835 domain-containing protein [Siminovitchia sp. FSL H7-0308]|uniref:DUF1835 domain-containing protein n=1 Tax=Siminovitchia thermophila TaxID=1245522 RepID=A0ABS2RA65_9BACI|nr:DUF1835 domain-containing protein [Siminovitchia thermophila]MBM7716235.1 hypothetical protein [Siminovitchia thermophila]ONK24086.1 hypothetical protein BLX87_06285 [Bacillus sp. VT-16-64]
MKDLSRIIDQLPGSEAKNILVNIMYRLDLMKESPEIQDEMIKELYSLYDEIVDGCQNDSYLEREYEAVHIACGEAAAGSLRVGLDHKNKVIGFPDFFAVGPIWQLHRDVGRQHRYEWLKNHIHIEMDYMEEEYKQKFLKALEEIKVIPDRLPIVLWTAENADEQTGMRYILYLLKEKANPVFLIHSTLAYKELYDTEEYQSFRLHTGEIEPEKLKAIDHKMRSNALNAEKRKRYEGEWMALADTKEVLRIWEKGQIKSVSEHYFDAFIIECAQKLQADHDHYDSILSTRVIGEVLGNLDQSIGDAFLEYRLRTLIYKGVFEIKEVPKSMRFYSVKLR